MQQATVSKWTPIVSRRVTVLRTFLTAEASRDEVRNYLGTGCDYLTITKDDLSHVYLNTKDTQKVSTLVLERIKQTPNFPEEHAQDCRYACETLIESCKEIAAEANIISTKLLKTLFDRYHEVFVRFAKFMVIPVAIEHTITNHISELLAKRVPQDQAPQYLSKLMTPPILSDFQVEQLDLLRLAIRWFGQSETSEFKKAMEDHTKKYQWLSCYNIDEQAQTEGHFFVRIYELLKSPQEKLEKNLHQLIEQHNQDQLIYEAILKELDFDENSVKEIDLLRKYVHLRTYRVEMQSKSNFFIQPLFKSLSSFFQLPVQLVVNLSPQEINDALENLTSLPSVQEIEIRSKDYGLRYDVQGIYFIQGKEAVEKLRHEEFGEINTDQNVEIKGVAAYKGVPIRGSVRIVLNKEDMKQFITGEILVTTMTTPEFVPIMEKALAIVTNEGGVLCHAAIIARELQKPCIIGTRIATNILKTGDLVEVDADKGIVKIVEKISN